MLLLPELESTGRIAFRDFWLRRARRLLPALFLVLVAVALFGVFVATNDEALGLRGDLLGSLFYVQNWRLVLVGSELLRGVRVAVATAAHVVARDRGAVVRHLAAAVLRHRARWRVPTRRLVAAIIARTRRRVRAPHGRAVPPGRRRLARLLRHRHPGAGPPRRRCARRRPLGGRLLQRRATAWRRSSSGRAARLPRLGDRRAIRELDPPLPGRVLDGRDRGGRRDRRRDDRGPVRSVLSSPAAGDRADLLRPVPLALAALRPRSRRTAPASTAPRSSCSASPCRSSSRSPRSSSSSARSASSAPLGPWTCPVDPDRVGDDRGHPSGSDRVGRGGAAADRRRSPQRGVRPGPAPKPQTRRDHGPDGRRLRGVHARVRRAAESLQSKLSLPGVARLGCGLLGGTLLEGDRQGDSQDRCATGRRSTPRA